MRRPWMNCARPSAQSGRNPNDIAAPCKGRLRRRSVFDATESAPQAPDALTSWCRHGTPVVRSDQTMRLGNVPLHCLRFKSSDEIALCGFAWLHLAPHEAKTAPERNNGRPFIFDALHETVAWPPVRRSTPKHIRAKSFNALGLKSVFRQECRVHRRVRHEDRRRSQGCTHTRDESAYRSKGTP
jgi:hypothetical protein